LSRGLKYKLPEIEDPELEDGITNEDANLKFEIEEFVRFILVATTDDELIFVKTLFKPEYEADVDKVDADVVEFDNEDT